MESDKIKGVVIITLPPPDNPSLGKSITAFTLTDDFSESPRESVAVGQEEREPNSNHLTLPPDLPIQTPSNQRSIPLSRELFAGTPRKLVVLLSIALVAIYLYSSSFPETLQELRSSEKNDDDRRTSLLFPLYFQSELGDSSDFQLKLGRTKGLNKDDLSAAFNDVLGVPKPTKLISSTLKSDSSAVFPVRGDIYPDGYVFLFAHTSSNFFIDFKMVMWVNATLNDHRNYVAQVIFRDGSTGFNYKLECLSLCI